MGQDFRIEFRCRLVRFREHLKMKTPSTKAKMMQLINWRMRVTIQDTRHLVGTFLAFDKHYNIVLGDCVEFRQVEVKGQPAHTEQRVLGVIVIRGESVITLQAESPPPKRAQPKPATAFAAAPAMMPIVPMQMGRGRGM